MTWFSTADELVTAMKAFTGDTDSSADDARGLAAAAVLAYVPTIPAMAAFMEFGDPTTFDPPDDVNLGAVMLAARWFARRGAVLGQAAGYGDLGTVQILRWDPDIARLLRIGSAAGGLVFGAPTLPDTEEVPA